MKMSSIQFKTFAQVRSGSTLIMGLLLAMAASGAPDQAGPAETPVRQVYVVETAKSSAGRLFLAPTEPREGVVAGVNLALRGVILSRTTSGSRRMLFEVASASGDPVYSVDLTVVVEPGSAPFGFEWSAREAPEGDYVARVRVLDARLGEDARAQWDLSVRDSGAVASRVEAARAEVARLRRESGETMPAGARQELALASEALAGHSPDDRPLIETDRNASFAMTTAARVRARLTFGRLTGAAAPAPETGARSARSFFSVAPPVRGAIVMGAGADSGRRLAELGFDFVPWMGGANSALPPGDLPVFVWLAGTEGEAQPRTIEELQPFQGNDNVAAISLWSSPRAPAHDAQTVAQFRKYVEGVYGDRVPLNRAWKQHLFSFDEVEFWPGIRNRAYQYDVQSFERQRTSQWLLEAVRGAASVLAPVAVTITFGDGVMAPGAPQLGLDPEALAPALSVLPVRIAGPLDDARFAQRYPRASALYALYHSFSPGTPLVAVHSIDYDLNDRLRMDSAAQLRTLAVEAAIEGVSGLAIEMPAIGDAARGAPEAVAGFAGALRDLRGADEAIAAIRGSPPPVVVLWSDSTKAADDGAEHLGALMNAYEGCSFSGQGVRFITERQLANGQWNGVRVLVLPEVSALTKEAFDGIDSLIAGGAAVIRTESGPVYDEHRRALGRTLHAGANSVLVRGTGEARDYLDAIDGLVSRGTLPDTLRVITRSGYPIEGVKTRHAEGAGCEYLYVVNLRKEPVACRLNRAIGGATDMLTGRAVEFPRTLDPLDPMVLRIDTQTASD